MYDYTSVSNKDASKEIDLEAGNGETLYPCLSLGENQLRWRLIRKVYGILVARLVLTTIISRRYGSLYSHDRSPRGGFGFKHPVNPIILGLFTVSSSLLVGASRANIEGRKIVLRGINSTSTRGLLSNSRTLSGLLRRARTLASLDQFSSLALIILILTSFIRVGCLIFVK
ncbi:unnamed protein product [Dovyalis caffra]|uniref:Uncharacterized protein n=1 Tax=Dovyalis caffra TaxID=77055 RepID=A0AAV1SI99_9ROSI|nr:unnamed protein product [Dovyalis caffra]